MKHSSTRFLSLGFLVFLSFLFSEAFLTEEAKTEKDFFALELTLGLNDHLLISEIVVTPTIAEYIEIYNPTNAAVDLSNYFLSDDMDYAFTPGIGASGDPDIAGPEPNISSFDFIARFPASASIPANGVIVVAFDGAGFNTSFGFDADFELKGTSLDVADMEDIDIGSSAGLTDSGESLILYTWDGLSDLIQDIDLVRVGTPSSTNDIGNKTGSSVDGPDPGVLSSNYENDAFTMTTMPGDPGVGESQSRIRLEEEFETLSLGNGITGNDETTEDIVNTFSIESAPSPGITNFIPTDICINEIDVNQAGTDNQEFIELFGTPGASLDNLVLVRFDGGDDMSYSTSIDLDDEEIGSDGFFVIGSANVPNVDLEAFTSNGLGNGPDAVALLVGDASDFPSGTAVGDVNQLNILSAIVYGINHDDDEALLTALDETIQYNEAANGNSEIESISRIGECGEVITTTTPTPGAPNAIQFDVEFSISDFICVGEPITVNATFIGGSGSYALDINNESFTSDQKQASFTLASLTNAPNSYFTINIDNIRDDVNNQVITQIFSIQVVDCNLQNDFLADDPCSCTNDQSDNGAQDGSFSETISVRETSANQVWSIKSINGLIGGAGLDPVKKPPVGAAVAITEFLNNVEANEATDEYIELFNYGTEAVNLEGWKLKGSGSEEVILPAYNLASGAFVILADDTKAAFETKWFGGTETDAIIEIPGNYNLNNAADEIILEDPDGNLIWSLSYPTNIPEGQATVLTIADLANAPMVYGANMMPGLVIDGDDLGMVDFPGYEGVDPIRDAGFITASTDDEGTPLSGPYTVLSTKDMPIQMGTRLFFDPVDMRHTLTFLHFDDSGYEVKIEGPNPMGDPNNTVLTLSNICAYPEVAFDPDFSFGLPDNGVPIVFGLSEVNGFPEDENQPAQFMVDGIPATQFEPFPNIPGDYIISGEFKAAFENNNGGILIDPANPGCITNISEPLTVLNTVITTDDCTCSDQVNVTLTPDCSYELLLDQVSVDACFGLRVQVNDGFNSNGAIIDCPGIFEYGIFDGGNNLMCWGTVSAEDKTGPVVTLNEMEVTEFDCSKIDEILNQEASTKPTRTDFFGNVVDQRYYIGRVEFEDNCVDCGCGVTTEFSDVLEYYDCSAIKEDGTVGRLIRTWTAIDCNGFRTTEQQVFRIFRPALEDVLPMADVTIQTCDASTVTLPAPRPLIWLNDLDGTTTSTDLDCNYGFEVVDGPRFSICDGTGYKFERTYRVIDWCTGESTEVDKILVKVGDFEAPEFNDCTLDDEEFQYLTDDADTYANYSLSRPNELVDAFNSYDMDASFIRNLADNPITSTEDNLDIDICISTISTGPMNCTAAINTSLTSLSSTFGLEDLVMDCPDVSITTEIISWTQTLVSGFPTGEFKWQLGGYTRQGEMAVGLPIGLHAIIISAADGCYNDATAILFLEVEDQVKPVMKCDDELRVTLVEGDAKIGIGGYALATYRDVDEGSWDNCSLDSLQVRREISGDARTDWELKNRELEDEELYTPWADIVEFFCADALDPDNRVKVELQGTDSNGNKSICWLDVHVENGTNYRLELDGDDDVISCLEEFDASKYAKIVDSGTGCATIDAELGVIADLNECGDGTYKIFIDDSTINDTKNASYIDADTITVTVKLAHDYWIKFPADVRDYCTVIDDLEGVVVSNDEDVACDLLAIYRDTPERFVTNLGDDDCYKLFQTYKVINWCEYDGESIPVIVSRDWDAPNGYDCYETEADAGEYNMNPQEPDGDGTPGNSDLYVIVDVNDADQTGIVYYDSDADAFSGTATDDSATDNLVETYWWAVDIAGSCAPTSNPSAWYDEDNDGNFNNTNDPGFDIDGTDSQDDNDNRYGSFGYWQYTQHIIVKDTSAPVVTVGDAIIANAGSLDNLDCDAEVTLPIDIFDACSVADLTVQVIDEDGIVQFTGRTDLDNADPNNASFSFPAGNLGLGTYTWTVRVNDGCGNITEEEANFEVKDVKAPAPICYEDLTIELALSEEEGDARAMAVIWASDFMASPIGDCTGQGSDLVEGQPRVTKFSINRLDSMVVEDQIGLTLTCADANDLVSLEVHAWDETGNHDFCTINILVQDNNQFCNQDVSAAGLIAGAIATEENRPVEGVEVRLSGNSSKLYMTSNDGEFGFENIEEGHDYSVTPQMDNGHTNGVSTFDLILIQKHILGSQILNSPYKMIAADVNNSKSISTIDLIQLRKLILNIDTEFSNNTSWRFVEADYRFANPSNPWASGFPEIKNINNLDRNDYASFVAIKVGDVNASALVEARSATGQLALQTAEQSLIAGNEYTVTFRADRQDIAGYQFTLNVDNAEIIDIVYGVAKAEHFGVFAKEGVLTTSFNGEAAGELFSLVIRATADVNLSEALTVNDRYTAAEAYFDTDGQDELLDVKLAFTGATTQESAFSLTQNTPNPFQGETVIGFNLPSAGEATLTIQDVAGRTVKLIEGDFAKGYNQVNLKSNDLPNAGVYFYTLTAGTLTATKKMVIAESINRR